MHDFTNEMGNLLLWFVTDIYEGQHDGLQIFNIINQFFPSHSAWSLNPSFLHSFTLLHVFTHFSLTLLSEDLSTRFFSNLPLNFFLPSSYPFLLFLSKTHAIRCCFWGFILRFFIISKPSQSGNKHSKFPFFVIRHKERREKWKITLRKQQ